jgi:hypothetical protein
MDGHKMGPHHTDPVHSTTVVLSLSEKTTVVD